MTHRYRSACTLIAGAFLLCLLVAPGGAQQPALVSVVVPHVHDSGAWMNAGQNLQAVYVYTISHPGADALRVFFSSLALGPKDFVEVSGDTAPGSVHRITSLEAAKWRDSSAYFNGDVLTLKLYLHSGSMGRFIVSHLDVGMPGVGPDTICGATDDRVPTNDNRVCRILSSGTTTGGGCTGWLASIDDCGITAGHCASCCTGVAEFNVPLSTSSGSIQHPPVSDQFPIDGASVVFVDGGIGNDYAVYRILPNNLGQSPAALFGWFEMGDFVPSVGDTMRITGFGSGGGSLGSQYSQTNRTHTGPYTQTSGTRLQYAVDTSGGNSGSPVIHEATGKAVGVHTHGGCTTSGGANSGTSFTLAGFNAAHMAMCAQGGFFFDLSTSGGGARDLHMQVLNLPPATVQGYTLFSLDTSGLVGAGALVGLQADTLTLQILMRPGGAADPLHWVAPFIPNVYPDGPIDLAAGSVPFLAGTSIDGVAVALGPAWSLLGTTNVVRLTF